MDQASDSKAGGCSADLQWICRSTLQAAFPSFRDMEIEASFYPYIGLTHTIRRRGSKWVLRISDHCRRAPRVVLEAITLILASKITRRRPPRRALQVYERFRTDPFMEKIVRERRLQKGRKQIRSGDGKYHSLHGIYLELNRRYFNDQVEIRKLGWGPRRSWRRLGHYDPVHHTITISPVLDSSRVPRSVVAYIVYHEMLHTLYEDASPAGTRRHHPPEYRRAERSYPDFASAKRFLKEFCAGRKA